MKMFLLGWFLAIFGTHYFGWEDNVEVGFILLIGYVFYKILFYGYNVNEQKQEGDENV